MYAEFIQLVFGGSWIGGIWRCRGSQYSQRGTGRALLYRVSPATIIGSLTCVESAQSSCSENILRSSSDVFVSDRWSSTERPREHPPASCANTCLIDMQKIQNCCQDHRLTQRTSSFTWSSGANDMARAPHGVTIRFCWMPQYSRVLSVSQPQAPSILCPCTAAKWKDGPVRGACIPIIQALARRIC
nr:hypothetical protein CFP56_24409 [Quercus suber]